MGFVKIWYTSKHSSTGDVGEVGYDDDVFVLLAWVQIKYLFNFWPNLARKIIQRPAQKPGKRFW